MKTTYIDRIYASLIAKCLQNIIPEDSQPVSTVVYGGRGLGKTPILRAIACRLKTEKSKEPFVVDGKRFPTNDDGSGLGGIVKKYESSNALIDVVLIDDIDKFILGGRSDDIFEAVDDRINAIRNLVFHAGKEVLGTSVINLYDLPPVLSDELLPGPPMQQRRDMWTNWIAQFGEFCQLNPWEGDWRRSLAETLAGLVLDSECNKAIAEKSIPAEWPPKWVRAIEPATGGHPALVYSALKLLFDYDDLAWAQFQQADSVDDELKVMTDTLRHDTRPASGVRHISRSLQMLSSFKAQHGKDALRLLQQLAAATDEVDWMQVDPRVTTVASECGLLRKNIGDLKNLWEIPGTIIRDLILDEQFYESSPGRTNEPGMLALGRIVTVETVDDAKGVGQVVITGGRESQILKISGQQWKLVKGLAQKQGQFVSYSELSESNDEIEKSMRNAKDVLMKKLDSSNMPEVIETEFGTGLRLLRTV